MAKANKQARREAGHYTAAELAITFGEAQKGRFDVLITHDWPTGLTIDRTCPVGDSNVRKLIALAGALPPVRS